MDATVALKMDDNDETIVDEDDNPDDSEDEEDIVELGCTVFEAGIVEDGEEYISEDNKSLFNDGI
jgi:hypothetical protein